MKKSVFTTLLLCFLSASLLSAAPMPRLTVVIALDGLRQDNMEYMRHYWSPGGLRTLQEEAQSAQLTFDFNLNGEEILPTILCGSNPALHGISYYHYFDKNTREVHSLFEDPKEAGIGTSDRLSPQNILVPTLSDYFRLRYNWFSRIYAVGLQPEKTILLAGHSANACCWLDTTSHQWVTTTYYPAGLPAVADEDNQDEHLPAMYQMPMVNSLVVDMALRLQQAHQLGLDDTPDLLMMHLSALAPTSTSDCILSTEDEDRYLAINQYIGFLFDQLNQRVGKEHLQVLLIGLPQYGQSAEQWNRLGMRIHPFNLTRATALTSVYLMALYGNERWIDGTAGNSIFLNRSLIEEKELNLTTIQQQVADFLMDFEGIQAAYTRREALLQPEIIAALAKKHIGDIVIQTQPNRQLMANETTPIDHIVDTNVQVPVYWLNHSQSPTPSDTLLPRLLPATQLLPLILNP